MANKKISELNAILQTNLVSTDVVVIARPGGETFKMTVAELDLRYNQATVRYYGDPDTNGTWRDIVVAGVFKKQVRVLGVYITKQEFEA